MVVGASAYEYHSVPSLRWDLVSLLGGSIEKSFALCEALVLPRLDLLLRRLILAGGVGVEDDYRHSDYFLWCDHGGAS
jgi:hypothetical protein